LIGIPVRVTVGEKTLAKNTVEVKLRKEERVTEVEPDQVPKLLDQLLKELH